MLVLSLLQYNLRIGLHVTLKDPHNKQQVVLFCEIIFFEKPIMNNKPFRIET